MQPTRTRADLWMDVALVAFLIGFDVVARVLPHAPGVWPVAASALFAGRMLRWPLFSLIVPVGAVALGNLFMPGDHWAVLLTVAAALCVPALLGMLARRFNGVAPTAAAMIASSLVFFAATNFAVWAFNNMYPMNFEGLVQCYVAALPFLDKTVLGDLLWTGVLFGGAWLVQRRPALRRAH